ncbi:MAG: hypothetical protein IJO34_01850 [Akkermansia sp.]|nr:hypothetical protein [Akkermansia sp.]
MSAKTELKEKMGCFFVCNIWLLMHAFLQLLLYAFLLYCGLCSLLLPLTFYIICCLASSCRQYVLLNVPIFLFLIGAFCTYPPMGVWFAVQWLPCFFFGLDRPGKRHLDVSRWGKILLYLLALLPYALLSTYVVHLWQVLHR